MLAHFFTYFEHPSAKFPGFGVLSVTHVLVLVILSFLSWLIIKKYSKLDDRKQRVFNKIIAFALVTLDLSGDLIQIVSGRFKPEFLPLQLCSMGIYVILVDSFVSSRFTREVLYAVTLPGAIAALITPAWASHPLFNFFSLDSFLVHTLLVTYIVMHLKTHEIVPSIKSIWRPLLFLGFSVPVAAIANHLWGTDFLYLNTAAAGSPLVPLQQALGSLYLLGFAGLVGIVLLIMYVPWIIKNYKESSRN